MLPLSSEQIAEIASGACGPVGRIDVLAGDASTRRFFRLHPASGESLVAMVFEEPIDPATHPQVLVGRYLESIGFPVPRLVAATPEAGILLYEDLGDLLLQVAGADRPVMRMGRLYLEAVNLIVRLQQEGTTNLPPDNPAARSALDKDRFLIELDVFRRHYIEGLRGMRLDPEESGVLQDFFTSLAEAASAPPWVLCHRDFHSRNLLVFEGRLRVIDFQDARLGHPAYDLVSLLRDSYVVLDPRLREQLIEDFVETSLRLSEGFGGGGIGPRGLAAFRRDFDIAALQRNLKAIGTFAHQSAVRGKNDYLPYIPPTWDYIFETLSRLPQWEEAGVILERASGR